MAQKSSPKPAAKTSAAKSQPPAAPPASAKKTARSSPPKAAASAPVAGAPATQPPGETWVDVLMHFARFAGDIAGVLCLALALMSLLGLLAPSLTSGLLKTWVDGLGKGLGWGAFWAPALTGLVGLWLFRRRFAPVGAGFWMRFVALELAAFGSLALFAVMDGMNAVSAGEGQGGGVIGWGIAELLRIPLDAVGLAHPLILGFIFGLIAFLSLLVGLGISSALANSALRSAAVSGLEHSAGVGRSGGPVEALDGSGVVEAPMQGAEARSFAGAANKRKVTLPPEFRKNFRIEKDAPAAPVQLRPRDDRLPPFELLVHEQFSRPDERTINQTAGLIEKTLSEFGIPARVTSFRVGPTVTQFAVEPGYVEKDKPGAAGAAENGEALAARQKVRVAQISSLGRDLALALSAERLRIEAPVPGRPYVGIEVPNPRASVVRLRPMLESEAFHKLDAPLAIALGRNVSGQPMVADLGRMPHILIAGTTGSGKSVFIEAITTCLVMNNTPEDLRLVMIDPKMVELVRFNGLPHLYGKVETDVERIGGVLSWVVIEMERRYKVLESSHSRNIDSYNRKMRARRHKGEPTMPRIVVLIDELADLMMSAPEQTEHNLVRLAQMARAVGIHLVVATQRPGVEVVTGLIKANFPARVSFAVASSVDSRVILDTVGAENLLGRGDMLFLPPDASGPQRLQGVMVSDQEVEKVISFWQKSEAQQRGEAAPEASPWDEMIAQNEILADRDNLVQQAIDIVRQERRANASLLQRRLRIGYPRAARLLDELEDLGIIGPSAGGGRDRELLMDEETGAAGEED